VLQSDDRALIGFCNILEPDHGEEGLSYANVGPFEDTEWTEPSSRVTPTSVFAAGHFRVRLSGVEHAREFMQQRHGLGSIRTGGQAKGDKAPDIAIEDARRL